MDESFDGLITRTNTLAFTGTGTAAANRISDVVDLEATLHLTKHLRLIEKFYFWAYRIPENGNFNEFDYSCAAPPCYAAEYGAHLRQHLRRNTYHNPVVLQPDLDQKSDRTGLGHFEKSRGTHRLPLWRPGIQPLQLIFCPETRTISSDWNKRRSSGFWARPTHTLRLNFDLEHTNYDDVIVRMSPRKESRYRFQTTYTPRPWAILGGSINILQRSNADAETKYVGHNRNYGLTASLAPRERFGVDLAYNYNDVIQNALICFNDTPPTGVILPFVANADTKIVQGTILSNPLLANSFYTNHTNFGMATVRFKPAKRVMANVGYSITSVDGSVPQFNVLQPLGSLQYKYQQPVANLSVDIGHKWVFNTGWNYYQYGEGSFVGPTAPRYFHANSLTESLRYAF